MVFICSFKQGIQTIDTQLNELTQTRDPIEGLMIGPNGDEGASTHISGDHAHHATWRRHSCIVLQRWRKAHFDAI